MPRWAFSDLGLSWEHGEQLTSLGTQPYKRAVCRHPAIFFDWSQAAAPAQLSRSAAYIHPATLFECRQTAAAAQAGHRALEASSFLSDVPEFAPASLHQLQSSRKDLSFLGEAELSRGASTAFSGVEEAPTPELAAEAHVASDHAKILQEEVSEARAEAKHAVDNAEFAEEGENIVLVLIGLNAAGMVWVTYYTWTAFRSWLDLKRRAALCVGAARAADAASSQRPGSGSAGRGGAH